MLILFHHSYHRLAFTSVAHGDFRVLDSSLESIIEEECQKHSFNKMGHLGEVFLNKCENI